MPTPTWLNGEPNLDGALVVTLIAWLLSMAVLANLVLNGRDKTAHPLRKA
jgi:hypothetical protein